MRLSEYKDNPIIKLSFDFAIGIVAYCEVLEHKKKFVSAKQLLKSGTSIGANVMEAQNPESNSDFIHKMKIAAKEANESHYWLMQKVLNKIIGTSKRNMKLAQLAH
jgi:four helix bundle protein